MTAVLKNGIVAWINGAGKGYWTSHRYTFVPIPDQDVSSLFEWEGDPIEGSWKFMGTNDDIMWEFPIGDLPHSEHIGKLISVTPANAKPVVVRRWYLGNTYDVSCLATEAVKDAYIAGDIQIDDWVLVSFIDEIPDTEEQGIAIVTDKIYKSW